MKTTIEISLHGVTRLNKRPLYISIMGTMGSGKTTVSKLLSKKLHMRLIEENFGENAFLPRFYTEMPRWAFHSQTFFLMEKTQQLLEIAAVLRIAKDPKRNVKKPFIGLIQDTPIYQDVFSYAKAQHVLGNIDDAEWRLYLKIYLSFLKDCPVPDLIIYLETSTHEVERRIQSRGRHYEQQIPTSYFELLDMLNRKWLSENTKIKTLVIKTDDLNIIKSTKARDTLVRSVKKRLAL